MTRKGFPPSTELPSVTPVVLPSGAVRIVEAFSGATIEWSRTKNHKDWVGQFLYANSIAAPGGVVRAFADPAGGTWSAWTELFPDFGESELVLAQNLNGEHTTVLDHHAFLVALARAPAGPEVAADDYVDLEGARTVYAGPRARRTGERGRARRAISRAMRSTRRARGTTCCSMRPASSGTAPPRRPPRASSSPRP